MSVEFDVVVLGGGVAGVSAALAAAEKGLRIGMASGPAASTAMYCGAWRGPCPDILRRALRNADFCLDELDGALPHASGQLLHADFATARHAASQLRDNSLVLGIHGLGGFEPSGLARQFEVKTGTAVASDFVEFAGTPPAGWSVVALANRFDNERDEFLKEFRRAAEKHRANHLVVPAVLGVRDAPLEYDGLIIGEALSGPPSIPGLRLKRALEAVCRNAGVAVVPSPVVAAEANRAVLSVTTDSGQVLRGRTFVLATGKFTSGGITANGAFREAALNCPLWIDHLGEVFENVESLVLTDPIRTGPQPLLAVGVHADDEGHPITRAGETVYENVFVAGMVRAGWSIGTHGIGDAAQDGVCAGRRAANATCVN